MQRILGLDGVALAVTEAGSGNDRPMLFVHGLGCDHTFLAPQQRWFARNRRTVSVDLRGHGLSGAPLGDYTVERFAEDLAWICEECDLTDVIVVGHSMGGSVALELAARAPGRVAGAVLIDTVMFPGPEFAAVLGRIDSLLREGDLPGAFETLRPLLFLPEDEPAVTAKFAEAFGCMQPHVLVGSLSHIFAYDPTEAAATCKVPLAYIGAAVPLADLARLRSLHAGLMTGQTLGSGHFAPLLVPDQVNAMLEAVSRSLGRTGRGATSPAAAA